MRRQNRLVKSACNVLGLIACLMGSVTALGQTARYVTDQHRLESRSGPSTEHKILQRLASGTRVDELERRSGYSRVVTPEGREVWILSRFLQDELPAREQVDAALRDRERHRREADKLKATLNKLRESQTSAKAAAQKVQSSNRALRQELAEIKQAAASTLATRRENVRLTTEVTQLNERLGLLETEHRKLKESDEQEWLVAGGGVLVVGLVLGLILPKLGGRRRRGWSDL